MDAQGFSSNISYMVTRNPKGLARMAGRMWLGAPALAVLFTCGVAEAVTHEPDALISAAPESRATPRAWTALPALAERITAGLTNTTSSRLYSTTAVPHAAFWLTDRAADRRVLECLHVDAPVVAKLKTPILQDIPVAAGLFRDPGHASPPTAAP